MVLEYPIFEHGAHSGVIRAYISNTVGYIFHGLILVYQCMSCKDIVGREWLRLVAPLCEP